MSPPPLPASENASDAVSTFTPAMMASSPSSNGPNTAVATDPTQAAPVVNVPLVPAAHVCANCGNRLAMNRCRGCTADTDEQGNAIEPPTYYCNVDCQRNHWKTHQPQCKLAVDRRQLFRIGRLIQWAFYKSVTTMWYDQILEVKKTGDTEGNDGAQLGLWRCKEHDKSDFSADRKSVV